MIGNLGTTTGTFELLMQSMLAAVIFGPLLMLVSIALMGYDKKLRHLPALSVQFVGHSASKIIPSSWFTEGAAPSMSSDTDEHDDLFVIHRGIDESHATRTPVSHRRPRSTGAHRRSRLSGLHTAARTAA